MRGAWRRWNGGLPGVSFGGVRTAVPVGVSVGLKGTDDELLAQVEERLAQGYKKIKLKIKPGRDVEMVGKVRAAFPEAPLMADANSSYTLADLPVLKELDELDLMMVEQPLAFDDLRDHALFSKRCRRPICLDESIRGPGDTRLALDLGSGRIINIKPGRVGGFRSSLQIHDLCAEKSIPVWCGGMLEAGVGRAYNLALASLPNFLLPGDISESRRYWAEDIVEPEFVMEEGMMPVPSGPGIGVTVRRDRVEEPHRPAVVDQGLKPEPVSPPVIGSPPLPDLHPKVGGLNLRIVWPAGPASSPGLSGPLWPGHPPRPPRRPPPGPDLPGATAGAPPGR